MSSNSITKTTATTTATEPPPPPPPMNLKNDEKRANKNTKTCGFRLPKRKFNLEPGKFLKKLGAKLARIVSTRKQKSSCKVSSSSSSAISANLTRSRSCADPITDNSHRAQVVEDCIEFLNSSSCSLQRVNSVSASSSI